MGRLFDCMNSIFDFIGALWVLLTLAIVSKVSIQRSILELADTDGVS